MSEKNLKWREDQEYFELRHIFWELPAWLRVQSEKQRHLDVYVCTKRTGFYNCRGRPSKPDACQTGGGKEKVRSHLGIHELEPELKLGVSEL